jgi:tetratricopeptide (TPR) repeat protein
VRHLLSGLGAVLLAAPVGAQGAKPPAAAPDLKSIAAMVETGQLAPAEQRLRRILAQGGDPVARDLLGVVLSKQGRLEEAEGEFKRALAANPALLSALQHLARLHLSQKKEAEAIAELRRAAPLGPLDRDLGLALASVELTDGHPALAERQLRSVADRFGSVQALLQLARLQSGRKDTAAALESLRRAREIAPNSEEVLLASAETMLAAQGPLAALPVLDSLTRLCPTEGRYRYLQGVALIQAGDTEAAVSSLREADRLEPNQPPTLIALGTALNGRELYAEAKPPLLHGQSLVPDSVEAAAALAEAEEGLDELDAAEAHAQRALARAGTDARANLVLGLVRMKQERYAEARDLLEKAAIADPGSPRAHYQLSLAYAHLDDPARSQKHLELSRQKAKEREGRVKEVRRVTGFSTGGTQP